MSIFNIFGGESQGLIEELLFFIIKNLLTFCHFYIMNDKLVCLTHEF